MADDDPYESVAVGGLKLKGGKVKKNKKKKKKNKADEIAEYAKANSEKQDETEVSESSTNTIQKTAAELAFERSQEKRATERILKKASKTHKQRVEELNEYLGGLSEHYDIQKVSWTK